ncbi:MAG: energy-coupled thiamine transporter ThiT [Candidatus Izimaplasma sp.]|nr:energy-coupled thiamine transporter ThiT [Candidatus Izimaplasma bacterium]
MKKDIKVYAEVAILVGVAVVFDVIFGFLSKGIFPWGGSISPAMFPIFLIAYRRGIKTGLFAGFIFAIIQLMITGMISSSVVAIIPEEGIIGPLWIKLILVYLLDYIIPFTLLGLAGIFKNGLTKLKPLILGMVLASFIRYLSHGISGVLIWASYTEWFNETYGASVSPFIYSFVVYNLPYMAASLVLCILLGYIMFKRDLLTINLEQN